MKLDGNAFLLEALKHMGASYIYGACGPDTFDCSGLVKYVLWAMGGPDWRGGPPWYNAAKLYALLEPFALETKQFGELSVPLDAPAGKLAFYGPPGRADHVMLCVGDGRVYGACGGGKGTTVPTRGACVQYRGSLRYRPDFLALRSLPEARPSLV